MQKRSSKTFVFVCIVAASSVQHVAACFQDEKFGEEKDDKNPAEEEQQDFHAAKSFMLARIVAASSVLRVFRTGNPVLKQRSRSLQKRSLNGGLGLSCCVDSCCIMLHASLQRACIFVTLSVARGREGC